LLVKYAAVISYSSEWSLKDPTCLIVNSEDFRFSIFDFDVDPDFDFDFDSDSDSDSNWSSGKLLIISHLTQSFKNLIHILISDRSLIESLPWLHLQ
jgi:hypothetical protein